MLLNIAALSRCMVAPVATLSLPGAALARAITSATDLASNFGLDTRMFGDCATSETGWKSVLGL